MNIEELGGTLSKHPIATGAAIIAGGLILYLLFSGGGGSAAAPDTGSNATDVAAATQAYIADRQAQAQLAGGAQALQGQAQQIGGAVQIATIQAQTTQNANQLQANVDLAQINAAEQVQSLMGTLEAQTAQNAQNQQTAQAQIASATTIQTTQAVANAFVQQAQINAGVATAGYNAQVQLAQVQGNCNSFFGSIFGC